MSTETAAACAIVAAQHDRRAAQQNQYQQMIEAAGLRVGRLKDNPHCQSVP
jgi:hypothetical protein